MGQYAGQVRTGGDTENEHFGPDSIQGVDELHIVSTRFKSLMTQAAEARWLRYAFPGNVRELRNIVIRLITKSGGQRIAPRELEPELDLDAPVPAPAGSEPGSKATRPARPRRRSSRSCPSGRAAASR